MKRALLVITAMLCLGCSQSDDRGTLSDEPNLPAGRFTSSDKWVSHVTVVIDKESGREFACFFGRYHGYSRAMSCVQVKP